MDKKLEVAKVDKKLDDLYKDVFPSVTKTSEFPKPVAQIRSNPSGPPPTYSQGPMVKDSVKLIKPMN